MATATIDLDLSLIECDPEIQPREVMSDETISQYAEDMRSGASFPPMVVYHDRTSYWLSQGFHRYGAAREAGLKTFPAEVRKGTRQDAMWDAAGSNREHDTAGLRRSNADKRRAVMMALEARPKSSDNQIAKQVGVGNQLVGHVRESIFVNHKDTAEREVIRNGTTYTMQTGGIGHSAARNGSPGVVSRGLRQDDDELEEDEETVTGSGTKVLFSSKEGSESEDRNTQAPGPDPEESADRWNARIKRLRDDIFLLTNSIPRRGGIVKLTEAWSRKSVDVTIQYLINLREAADHCIEELKGVAK